MRKLAETNLGKWSVGLLGVFMLAFLLMQLAVMAGQRGGEKLFDNLFLAIPGLLGGISAIAAGVLGLLSIWKYKERSVAPMLATAIGLLITIFILGEFLSPH